MGRPKGGLWLPPPSSVAARLMLAIEEGEALEISAWRVRCGFVENSKRNSPVYTALHHLRANGWLDKQSEPLRYALSPQGLKARQMISVGLNQRQAELLALMRAGAVYRTSALHAAWNATYPYGRSISRVGLADLLMHGSQKHWIRSDRGVHSLTSSGLERQPSATQMLRLYAELVAAKAGVP